MPKLISINDVRNFSNIEKIGMFPDCLYKKQFIKEMMKFAYIKRSPELINIEYQKCKNADFVAFEGYYYKYYKIV